MTSPPTARQRPRWFPFVLPLVLWAVGSLYLGGGLDRWKDDYWLDFRDPVTNHANLAATLHRSQFWRPIYFIVTPALHSILADHFRFVHIISAVAFGLVCLVLWQFLRTCGLSAGAASVGALIFMLYPGHWKISLWATAMPTGVATGLFIAIAMIWLRAVRAEPDRQLGRLLIATPAMALLAFVVACINEQPTAGIPALPLLSLAMRRRGDPAARANARSIIPVAACALAVLVYLVLYDLTTAAGARGTAGTFVTDLASVRTKWSIFLHQFGVFFLFQGLGKGSLILGYRTIRESLPSAVLWGAALAAGAVLWAVWWQRRPVISPAGEGAVPRGRRLCLRRSASRSLRWGGSPCWRSRANLLSRGSAAPR